MLYGKDAHDALLEELQKRPEREGEPTWAGNTTMWGDFENGRADLVYLPRTPHPTYELKLVGRDEAGKKQLSRYLKAGGSGYIAGDPNLVFQGKPLGIDVEGPFGGHHYDYYPGKYPGVLGYTMRDREGKIQELGEYLWNGIKGGLSHPPGTVTPFGIQPPGAGVVPPYAGEL